MGFFEIFKIFSLIHLDYFDNVWDDKKFKYQKLSSIAFVAVCDFSPKGPMRNVDFALNKCGHSCVLLKTSFDSKYPSSSAGYSKSDHTHFVALTNENDVTVRGLNDDTTYANIFFSFRGTWVWDLVNMRRNHKIALIQTSLCEGCAVLDGAYKNFLALRSSVALTYLKAENIVAKSSREGGPLKPTAVVIGMSMGGHLANYGALYLRFRLSKDIKAIYTFGVPRNGNSVLHKYMKQIPNTQFAWYRDPVPHYPPKLFGFRTAAAELYILYLDPLFLALEEQGLEQNYYKFLHYKKLQGPTLDSQYSDSVQFFDVHDHNMYFIGLDENALFTCGGMTDYFLQNVKGTALFL